MPKKSEPFLFCDFCGRRFSFRKLAILPNEQQICIDCIERLQAPKNLAGATMLSSHRCNRRCDLFPHQNQIKSKEEK